MIWYATGLVVFLGCSWVATEIADQLLKAGFGAGVYSNK